MQESVDGLLACIGVVAWGWCTAHDTLLGSVEERSGVVRTGCTAGGRAGLASVVSAGRRARAWASRRPCAETFGRLGARARTGRQCVDRLGSARTRSTEQTTVGSGQDLVDWHGNGDFSAETRNSEARLRGYVAEIVWVRFVKAQTILSIQETIENLKMRVKEELPQIVEKGLESVSDKISCLTDAVDYKLEALKTDLRLVKKAVASSGTDGSAVAPKVRVPDPKPFSARVPDAEKVSMTSMYLTGDAKLWWRSCLSGDASANRERIETWEVLKKELKDQFLPCNTSRIARESLRNLKRTGTVREFVKEFSSLMLDVRDMSEEDKLFNFMAGLKPWAQTELRRQGVKDLPTAIAAADRLGDYKVPNEPEQRNDDSGDGKAKFGKKFKKKEKAEEVVTETSEPRTVERPRAGCFICGSFEHRAWDCPKRGRLNAIVAEQTDSERETELARFGAVQLGTLQVQFRGCGEAHLKGLMMVAGRINGKEMEGIGGPQEEINHHFVRGEYDGVTAVGEARLRSSRVGTNVRNYCGALVGVCLTTPRVSVRQAKRNGLGMPVDDASAYGGDYKEWAGSQSVGCVRFAHGAIADDTAWQNDVMGRGVPLQGAAQRWRTVSAGWRTVCHRVCLDVREMSRQAGSARTGSAARAHGRQGRDDCRQRPRLGGWLRGLKHKTCVGHVMGRLRLVTPSTWQYWEVAGKAVVDGFP
ncbi:hypothetical protein Sango_1891400 [Sesamum angolense]|uniref:CCHC-type domain-containing protein n=1 Tax=Sesamum angolense TaxID=2727404 RepID=A0AAE2BQM4_9LAMI|nr:hypothetical protein Sango_1891400 [Sesamum angolense]